MKILFSSCGLFLIAISAIAQTSPAKSDDKQITPSGITRADSLKLALYVMNDTPISQNYFTTIGNKIESLRFIKGHDAIALYGDKAKYGAVLITLKPQYKEEILHVPAKDFR